jgi:phenylalanyl-tRNA synthetase beta chain
MKISYKWLKDFIDTELSAEELSGILTGVGLEVESLEKIQSIPGGLEGIVIGQVKSRSQHPNADKLSITKVDIGTGEELQIVCGAANVAAGQKVVVATVGSTVHPVSGEPFKINKSKIRGEVSEGMICAEDEIGLGSSHEGIMVLPEDALVGMQAKEYFKLEDDYLFEIGLTPNRADAASHLGVAKDIVAYLNFHTKKKYEVKFPDVSSLKLRASSPGIKVEVLNTDACPRYSGLSISNIIVKESPEWLQNRLKIIGLKPINNIVDVTNYVCHALGQPMHAFDADQIKGKKIMVRNAKEGELFKTLDDVERKLSPEDLMICDETDGMCIAGVFGGIRSGVNENTKNIFLESAYFNSVFVRKTSKRLGLKTDASFRFERGTDYEMTVFALTYAAQLILDMAGGEISSEIIDIYPQPIQRAKVEVNYHYINRLIGKEISSAEIKNILTSLGFIFLKENNEGAELEVPSAKVDVTRECDITEEVLRIYGLNNIGLPSRLMSALSFSSTPDKEKVRDIISNMLVSQGFSEMLSNSLTKSSYSELLDTKENIHILNPLSNELDVLRQSMLFSGLEAIAYNQNRKSNDLKFFEFGTTYHKKEGKYQENEHLALFITGNQFGEHWNSKTIKSDFYELKSIIDNILVRLGLSDIEISSFTNELNSEGLRYGKGDKSYVEFGKVSKKALKKADVSSDVFYADFNWNLILKKLRNVKTEYKEVSKFPAVRRDLSMLLDKSVTFEKLKQIALKTDKNLLKEVNVFDVYEGDKLPAGKKSYALSFTLQDEEKTLNDKQIDSVMDKLIRNYESQIGAEIRKA